MAIRALQHWDGRHAAFGPLICAVVGGFIGWAAWGDGRLPFIAAALPLAVGFSGSRLNAFCMGLAYVLATERAGPGFMAGWFGGDVLITAILWLGSGLVGGLAWSAGWTASAVPWRRAAASVVAWALTLAPPVAVMVMGHPVIAWGYLLGGSGWLGVLASAAVPALILAKVPKIPWPTVRWAWLIVPVLGASGSAGVLAYRSSESQFVGDLVAISTPWGAAKDGMEILTRIERIGQVNARFAQDTDTRVLIYPESILQRYEPALFPVLEMEVINPAARAGQTIIVGTDLPTSTGNYETAAIAFYPDGKTATALARQTVPFALWRPWQALGYSTSDWTANNILTVKPGVRARIVFCYEEYIPILSLMNEAMDAHNLVIVLANTWASESELGPVIQARHSEGVAKLFGKRLLRAENRPKKSN